MIERNTPCKTVAAQDPNRKMLWGAMCTVHLCTTRWRTGSAADAVSDFLCDRGERWRFLLKWETVLDAPDLVDATLARAYLRARISQGDDVANGKGLRMWLWVHDATFEPLAVIRNSDHEYGVHRPGHAGPLFCVTTNPTKGSDHE